MNRNLKGLFGLASLALASSASIANASLLDGILHRAPRHPMTDATTAQEPKSILGFDSAMKPEEKALLAGDLAAAPKFPIETGEHSIFPMIFGGTSSPAVVQYLKDRLTYVLPQSVDLESKLLISTDDFHFGPFSVEPKKIYTVATNVGTILWFESLLVQPKQLYFDESNVKPVPITSSRIGIVQLGEGYTLKKNDQYVFPTVVRIQTLVHEARHSDCTGGVLKSDLELMTKGELPINKACGHLHSICPKGHPYEGAAACDDLPWGAYSVGAIYSAALAKGCPTCSHEDQTISEADAVDSLSRIIPLDDMLDGKLGAPDMTSSTQIIDK